MLSTIKGRLNLFFFLLTIMKKTSKGVDGRIVKDLETPQLNCFGKNGSLWWRQNPLPSKEVGRNWMKHQDPGRWGTEQALHLNSWLVWHPVTLLEATANILEQLAWDPTQWGVPKKHARSGIQRCNPPGTGRVDNTAPDFSNRNHKL